MGISYLVDTKIWGEAAVLIRRCFALLTCFLRRFSVCLQRLFRLLFFSAPPPPSISDFTDSSASAAFLSHQLPKQHHHQCLDSVGGFISLPRLLLGADTTPSKQHRPVRSKLSKAPLRLNFHRFPAQMNFIFTSFTCLSGLLGTEKSDHSWCSCICFIIAGKWEQPRTAAVNILSRKNVNLLLTANRADHVPNGKSACVALQNKI